MLETSLPPLILIDVQTGATRVVEEIMGWSTSRSPVGRVIVNNQTVCYLQMYSQFQVIWIYSLSSLSTSSSSFLLLKHYKFRCVHWLPVQNFLISDCLWTIIFAFSSTSSPHVSSNISRFLIHSIVAAAIFFCRYLVLHSFNMTAPLQSNGFCKFYSIFTS